MKPANLDTKNTSFGQYFKNGSRVVPQKCFEKFVVLKSWKISEKNVLKTPVVSQFWWHVKYSLIFKTFYKSIIFPYPVNLLHVLHTYNPQFGQQRLPILSLKPTYEMMDRVFFRVSLRIWKGEYMSVLTTLTKGWWVDDENDEKEQPWKSNLWDLKEKYSAKSVQIRSFL